MYKKLNRIELKYGASILWKVDNISIPECFRVLFICPESRARFYPEKYILGPWSFMFGLVLTVHIVEVDSVFSHWLSISVSNHPLVCTNFVFKCSDIWVKEDLSLNRITEPLQKLHAGILMMLIKKSTNGNHLSKFRFGICTTLHSGSKSWKPRIFLENFNWTFNLWKTIFE